MPPKKFFFYVLLLLFVSLGELGGQEADEARLRGYVVPVAAEMNLPEQIAAPESNGRKRIIGMLVVEEKLPHDSHVYSVWQPEVPGGMPTKITVTPDRGEDFVIFPFFDASPVKIVDFMGDKLLELEENAVWIAPIFAADNAIERARDQLAALEFSGSVDSLLCDDANCRPMKEDFKFEFNADYDLAAPLETCVDVLNIFIDNHIKVGTPPEKIDHSDAKWSPPNGAESGFGQNVWYDLLLAFFGGMILNVMPCVLPVICLKIIGFFDQAGQSRARAFTLNVWYSLGILAVFAVLALMSVSLSYLFTYGLFQIVMGGIVFVMALNLMGVWDISLPAFLGGKKSNELIRREGPLGAVFKGVITTLLAIPCGAPLLSPALVWTDSMIQQGRTGMALGVYLVIGLGMATPYLLLGAFPELLRFLPKPGLWMETFRNMMGFVLLLAVIWILFSMPLELVLPSVALLFALWFACWYLSQTPFDAKPPCRFRRRLLALVVIGLTVVFSYNIPITRPPSAPLTLNPYTLENASIGKLTRWAIRAERAGQLAQDDWTLFSQAKLDAALAEGKTVMVDFTADWCMNCKVLESTVLKSERIENRIREEGILTMTADWTGRDQTADGREVGHLLRLYGGEQVPVVMIFKPSQPNDPTILRGLFTVETLERALDK